MLSQCNFSPHSRLDPVDLKVYLIRILKLERVKFGKGVNHESSGSYSQIDFHFMPAKPVHISEFGLGLQ